jgi:hypothetical protein
MGTSKTVTVKFLENPSSGQYTQYNYININTNTIIS